ncbi:thiocillin family RiPP [Rummeliibacillus sp. SL167]|uniref:thiocillin family RiPP n=1 Tax=Rummeliibacillus sp. SL167 TaxID=2579792 RepID=UPI0011B3685D|nr:thiocillin family RiPP [Rummeliibacillus sp. SL167]
MEEKVIEIQESKIYIEEQIELNEVAASLGSLSTVSSGSCPGSSLNTVSTVGTAG